LVQQDTNQQISWLEFSMGFLEEQTELARKAAQSHDWQGALNIWETLRDRCPDSLDAFIGRAEALQALGRLNEADAGFTEARERFPKNEWAAVRYAEAAQKRRDVPEALRRWDEVINAFPDFPIGYLGRGGLLRDQGHLDEAQAIFHETMRRFPENVWAAVNYAGIAVQKRDWIEALRRWESVRANFPDGWHGFVGQAEALRELGRIAEADIVLTEATEKFPREEWPLINFARIAMARGNWEEALRRWETAIQYFSNNTSTYAGKAETLSKLGRFDEAEAVYDLAVSRFPDDALLAHAQATLAVHRGNWDDAIRH
jgi:tetratricopeptide (TPR) repeat protein